MQMPKLAIALMIVVLTIMFQNCSNVNLFAGNNSSGNQSSGAPSGGSSVDNGGQAYDGKPYIVTAKCTDGSLIGSQILLKSPTSALLVRKNCQAVAPPLALASSEFTFDANHPGQLVYQGVVYLIQVLSAPIAPLSKAYYQWNGSIWPFQKPITYFLNVDYGATILQQQRAAGHTVICLETAGTTNSTDPDLSRYLPADIGNNTGSGTERWLDTRSATVRAVMADKADRAKAAGCQGMLWDQTDAYLNNSGFALSSVTQKDFNILLAELAHDRGMLVALAHTADLSQTLAPYFDMQYSEGCYAKDYCDLFQTFANSGKPVFVAETGSYNQAQCDQAKAAGYTLWFTSAAGDGSRNEPCQ